jgi:hypothetical protein
MTWDSALRSYRRRRLTGAMLMLACGAGTGLVRAAEKRYQLGFASVALGKLENPSGGWNEQRLLGVQPNRFSVEADGANHRLRIDSQHSASSLVHRFDAPLASVRTVRWNWRVDRMLTSARFGERAYDDYAARFYVLFDYPLEKLPIGQRTLVRLGRSVHPDLPAATICYVWDAREPIERSIDSPFSARVKVIVVASGPGDGQWQSIQRDLQADFSRVFGAEYGAGIAPVAAIAVAADTDQTGERVSTWFGDIELVSG